MADSKITALTALTAADPVNDMFPIVDVSDTTMAASGTTKKISVNNILGASGTATLASATITGDLTVDTSTLKVDSTNNRVGIGLASGMTAPLEVQSNTSGTGINIRGRADNSGALRFFANDGTTQQAYISGDDSNIDIVSASTRPIRFIVNGTVVASVLNGGNVSIANGNLVMSTSGKGIDFSATTSGSGTMTSELLNDYEEGTWTPVLATDNVTFTSVGYTIQVGKYTKVGNLVTVTGTIQTNSVVIGSASGNVWITGLPFTQPSTDAPGGVNCFVAQSWAVDAPLAGYVFDSKIYLVERATSVSSSSLVSVADVATGGSNNLVRFSGHYYV
jgi:hypothetical protein